MLRFAQHDSSRVVFFTYLRNAPPGPAHGVQVEVFHRFVVFFHRPQGAVEKPVLPEVPAPAPPYVGAVRVRADILIECCIEGF